jgi:hypothetical protein
MRYGERVIAKPIPGQWPVRWGSCVAIPAVVKGGTRVLGEVGSDWREYSAMKTCGMRKQNRCAAAWRYRRLVINDDLHPV